MVSRQLHVSFFNLTSNEEHHRFLYKKETESVMGLHLAIMQWTDWIMERTKEKTGSNWNRPGKDSQDLSLGKGKVMDMMKGSQRTQADRTSYWGWPEHRQSQGFTKFPPWVSRSHIGINWESQKTKIWENLILVLVYILIWRRPKDIKGEFCTHIAQKVQWHKGGRGTKVRILKNAEI